MNPFGDEETVGAPAVPPPPPPPKTAEMTTFEPGRTVSDDTFKVPVPPPRRSIASEKRKSGVPVTEIGKVGGSGSPANKDSAPTTPKTPAPPLPPSPKSTGATQSPHHTSPQGSPVNLSTVNGSNNNPIFQRTPSDQFTDVEMKGGSTHSEYVLTSEHRTSTSLAGSRNKDDIPAPTVLTELVRSKIDIPSELLSRMLLKGESVTGQFDFYYLDWYFSRQMKVALCILSFGLIFIIAAVFRFIRYVRRSCCCSHFKDESYHRRGKLIVTSFGRILFWELDCSQYRSTIGQRAHYSINQMTHVCTIADLKQMKTCFVDQGLLLNGCCRVHEAGIELTFHSYNHVDSQQSKYLRTSEVASFTSFLNNFIPGIAAGLMQPATQKPLTILVVSTENDKVGTPFAQEGGQESLEFLLSLSEKIADQFSRCTNAFTPLSTNVRPEDKAFKVTSIVGVKELCTELSGFSLLDETEDNAVNVPLRYMPLMRDEAVIMAVGQRYQLSPLEWILSIFSLGVYFLARLWRKTMMRSALVLTNKRIIEITLTQGKGKFPVSFRRFRTEIRSYFPGKDITSGYIRNNGIRILSGLQTSAGHLVVSLPPSAFSIAQRIQMTESRREALPLSTNEIRDTLPKKFDGTHQYSDATFTPSDLRLIPLLEGEELLHRFSGGDSFVPCCSLNPTPKWISACFNPNWAEAASRIYLCTFLGWFRQISVNVVKCCTLQFRPWVASTDGVITANSLYFLSITQPNKSILNCCCKSATESDVFLVVWVGVRSLRGLSTSIHANGAHPVSNCCCGIGCMMCPEREYRSEYQLNVQTREGLQLAFRQNAPGTNWIEDPGFTKMVAMLGAVHSVVSTERIDYRV